MVPERPDGNGNEREDHEGRDPSAGDCRDLSAAAATKHGQGPRWGRVDGARLVAEEHLEITFESVHRSSPWAIVVRNVSEPRATSDLTAATLHPSTSAVSLSDRSS